MGNEMSIELVRCTVCDHEFNGSSNALYCSNKCKQAKHRASKKTFGFIYMLKKEGEVVYVGQSISEKGVKKRIISHTSGELPKEFDSHEYYQVDSKNLNEIEASEIIKWQPIYNRRLPSNSKYITPKKFSEDLSVFMEGVIKNTFEVSSLSDGRGGHNLYLKADNISKFKDLIVKLFNT